MDLVGLVSQEIYSRFNAMLTTNSILLAIIGWMVTSEGLSPYLTMSLPIVGLFLCGAWYSFVAHGVYWQDRFREEARRLEERYYIDTFRLISIVKTESPKSPKGEPGTPKWIQWFRFYNTSRIVIAIFFIIYVVMLYQMLYQISPPPQQTRGIFLLHILSFPIVGAFFLAKKE